MDDIDWTAVWVAEVNRLGRELDEYAQPFHPAVLEQDPGYRKRRDRWRTVSQGGEELMRREAEAKARRKPRKKAKQS